jgi:hypothetical protein
LKHVNVSPNEEKNACDIQLLVTGKNINKEEMENTHYWTVPLILDLSYLVGNLTNSKIAETKALEPPKSWHFCIIKFQTC